LGDCPALVQESKYSDSGRRSDVNLAIDHRRRDEFVPSAKLISPTGCPIAVVQFDCQISCVVGMQDRGV
jgi:hypothetical protein